LSSGDTDPVLIGRIDGDRANSQARRSAAVSRRGVALSRTFRLPSEILDRRPGEDHLLLHAEVDQRL
jgi:hypothetical protein